MVTEVDRTRRLTQLPLTHTGSTECKILNSLDSYYCQNFCFNFMHLVVSPWTFICAVGSLFLFSLILTVLLANWDVHTANNYTYSICVWLATRRRLRPGTTWARRRLMRWLSRSFSHWRVLRSGWMVSRVTAVSGRWREPSTRSTHTTTVAPTWHISGCLVMEVTRSRLWPTTFNTVSPSKFYWMHGAPGSLKVLEFKSCQFNSTQLNRELRTQVSDTSKSAS